MSRSTRWWPCLAGVLIFGASCTGQPAPKPGAAHELFAAAVDHGSLFGACKRVKTVCAESDRGRAACLAHELFCGGSEETTCNKLGNACISLGVACDLHKHCAGALICSSDGDCDSGERCRGGICITRRRAGRSRGARRGG